MRRLRDFKRRKEELEYQLVFAYFGVLGKRNGNTSIDEKNFTTKD